MEKQFARVAEDCNSDALGKRVASEAKPVIVGIQIKVQAFDKVYTTSNTGVIGTFL